MYASAELVFSMAVKASMAVGPLPFNVTYPIHNHDSGKIRQVMRRAMRKPGGGRLEIAAPERMAASTAAMSRTTGRSPKSSVMVGQTQAAKKRDAQARAWISRAVIASMSRGKHKVAHRDGSDAPSRSSVSIHVERGFRRSITLRGVELPKMKYQVECRSRTQSVRIDGPQRRQHA